AGIGFILANLERTAAKLRKAATHDSLTGCISRGPFEAMLRQARERARREGTALSLLLMDLDHFKQVNDTHGHEGGDEVLRRFAHAVQSRLRASDILGRMGGEEFAVILPATGAAGAAMIAEELRRVTEALDVPAPQGARIAVTVSVGAAAVEAGAAAQAHDALYGQADSALYASKRAGRNRTTSFSACQCEAKAAAPA
ncbi:MAG TPA: GGDEF domain-containing protein, partial [Methylibium sp.]